ARHAQRALERDPRPGRASTARRPNRGAEQQLGDSCPSRARLPRPRVSLTQAPLHDRQSHPHRRRHSAIPRSRHHAALAPPSRCVNSRPWIRPRAEKASSTEEKASWTRQFLTWTEEKASWTRQFLTWTEETVPRVDEARATS